MSTGFDFNRMAMLIAVLEKRAGFFFNTMDAYINVVSGLRLDEPAADLSVAMALVSSLKDAVIGDKVLAFGEIGLAGEIRAVSHCEQRVQEAGRLGFQRCVIPATGFYEWDSAKHKYFFQMPGQPLYLAGIYDNISGVNCFIILTTAPNDSVAPIHDRMPLLLSHEQVRPWLVDAGAALELLCSRPPLLLRTSCDGQLGFDDLL